MIDTPPVTFCFPYRPLSGVPLMFAQMARYLAERDVETSIVDYRDGCLARTLSGHSRVRLREFVPGSPVKIPNHNLLVLQSVLPYKIWPEIRPGQNTRLLFWTLHPLCWVPTLLPFPWTFHFQAQHPSTSRWLYRSLLGKLRSELEILLTQLVQTGSVIFEDGATVRATTELTGIRFDKPAFVPLPCDVPDRNLRATHVRSRREKLAFGYLGRLADFKMPVLMHTMNRLASYAARTRTPMVFHVIGEGPLAHQLDRVSVDPRWFTVQRAGVLTGDALDNYLLEQVDVLAAMGHSALHGGRLGVPTILLDVFYGRVPSTYHFRWLFESTEYVVGEIVTPEIWGGHTVDEIVAMVHNDDHPLSERTYRYCFDNHRFPMVAERFLAATSAASLRYGDLRPAVVRKSAIRRSYEFLRDAAHSARHDS